MKKAIIVDLDGTLCNIDHRLPLITTPDKKKDWTNFYESMIYDMPNMWCYDLITKYSKDDVAILYVTGRPDTYRSHSMDWLRRYSCPISELHMRPSKDNRKDSIIKKEIFESYIQPVYEILFCIEDRSSVVQMWRSQGLICLQCASGDF